MSTIERLTALRDKALSGELTQEDLDREALATDFDIVLMGEHYLDQALERQKEYDEQAARTLGAS